MKFATIAATVLVASSVLGTAGVVSADDILTTSGVGHQVDGSTDYTYTADGKASVNVEKGADAQFTIDNVAGLAQASGDKGLDFGTVTLTQLAQSAKSSVERTADFDKGAFTITNTMGIQKWNLSAVMENFTDGKTRANDFGGELAINGHELKLDTDTTLYSSTDTVGFDNAGDNGSHAKWESPSGTASVQVPTYAKVGNYTAKITYKLSATPTGDVPSNYGTQLPENPVVD